MKGANQVVVRPQCWEAAWFWGGGDSTFDLLKQLIKDMKGTFFFTLMKSLLFPQFHISTKKTLWNEYKNFKFNSYIPIALLIQLLSTLFLFQIVRVIRDLLLSNFHIPSNTIFSTLH